MLSAHEETVLHLIRENHRGGREPLSPRALEERAICVGEPPREVRIATQALIDSGRLYYDAKLRLVLQQVAAAKVERDEWTDIRTMAVRSQSVLRLTIKGRSVEPLSLDEAAEVAAVITKALAEGGGAT